MKNKTGIIILLVLLSIIILGLVIFLVRYLCGGGQSMIRWGRSSNNVIFNQTYTLEEIQDIDIKQDAGDIIFKEASDDNIEVVIYGDNTQDVNVNLSYEKLSIDYTKKMRFFFFSFGTVKNDIIVYVPTKYAKDITIKNDYGNCEIGNFEKASIDVECDAGNVEVGKIRNANIQCDLGGVKVEEVLNKCNISVDSGNVRIDRLSIQENSFIKADLGNVTVNEINDIYVDAKVDLGNSTVNGSNRNSDITLKIECDCGNIKVGK